MSTSAAPEALGSPAARLAIRWYAAGSTVYGIAVLGRSAFGVAGIEATHRFGISPAQLGSFVMVQLAVYTAMQLPAGLLVDRFGSRILLACAGLICGGAQLFLAVASDYPTALIARALLGLGDSLVFVSLLRLIATSFPPPRYALFGAIAGTLGTLGNALATLPLTLLLRGAGWTTSFVVIAGVSITAAVMAWLVLPPHNRVFVADRPRIGSQIATVWRQPGTRLGFWVHWATASTAIIFALLWGMPYMVDGLGLSKTTASALLLLNVVASLVYSPSAGWFASRFPHRRMALAYTSIGITAISWAVLLTWPGRPPLPILVIHILLIAFGPSCSIVGLAIARDHAAPEVVGTATGLANAGAWTSTTIGVILLGVVLDLLGAPNLTDYRIAWAATLSLHVIGFVMVVRWQARLTQSAGSRQVRRLPADHGG